MAIPSVSERDWLYVLTNIHGLGRKKIRIMYDMYGSFSAIMEDWREAAEQLNIPQLVRNEVKQLLITGGVCQKLQEREEEDVPYLCFLDDDYPNLLRHIPDPPLTLFYRGDIDLLRQPAIGVVGSRKPTQYGRSCCAHLVKQLVQAGIVIVSGLAYGIDGEAHQAALHAEGKTVGVLGCGIDHIYPAGHRNLYKQVETFGLIISEHPPGVRPNPGLFPERNRIISGLSLGVLVVEAAEKSGSLITADCALEQGREVFAIPGSIFSSLASGPHNLIKQGAKLVTSSADVLEELGLSAAMSHPPQNHMLEGDEAAVLAVITAEGVHADEMKKLVGPEEQKNLHQTLIRLEAKGTIVCLPGGYYARR